MKWHKIFVFALRKPTPMNKPVLAIILLLSFALHTVGQNQVFHAVNLVESEGVGLFHGVPAWAINGDTNLSWITDEILSTSETKNRTIRFLYQTDPMLSVLDTLFEIPLDTIAQVSFMHDINHDGKLDFLLYGMLPFCNFQPYIYILLNRDTAFQVVFQHEGNFVGWRESDNATSFQILVNGCCEDRHGYLFEYSSAQEDTLTQSAFWQLNAMHPATTDKEKTITIDQDSTILLPAAGSSDRYQNDLANQFNWTFFKGDIGKVLYETVLDDHNWCYVRMPVRPRNEPQHFNGAAYVYGWLTRP